MAKVKVSLSADYKDVTCYRLEKKRGTITQREAYEAMESEGYFGQFRSEERRVGKECRL